MINIYTQRSQAERWLQCYQGQQPEFVCVLGFTETGLIPGISAAGATPNDRRHTALADAEFLYYGVQSQPRYPLPPLQAGASPTLISRAIVEQLSIPTHIVNAGLLDSPPIPSIDCGGEAARCLSTGQALDLTTVKHLFQTGLQLGQKLGQHLQNRYLIIGECVVGGTTTALALLLGLGIPALGKVNSSHPTCNHTQKQQLVQSALQNLILSPNDAQYPLQLLAAIGDPMQPVVAGMMIAASSFCGVLLAGGTQMLAVYALAQRIQQHGTSDFETDHRNRQNLQQFVWNPENILVGTTRWVAEDPTGDTIGLSKSIGKVPLIATALDFTQSRYPQLQVYEQGFVKEGVGAGGCAIAAHLYQQWNNQQLVTAVEDLLDRQQHLQD
ncbi:nicotinate mononucleotide-dependent phosphoribosyltransferase CobT [Alkalinema pantanalense CENA528]|uniref:nicotinate mononucleotide-dependent phosphoribosyltransferase CobT n=1 Tax=Alkalinema pantanalense TaxID=1620705 RepID=UPI003D6EDA38